MAQYRQSITVSIVDRTNPKLTAKIVDYSHNILSKGIIYDMDVVRQSVISWVLTNWGDRLFDLSYGSNLIALIGKTEKEFYTFLGSISLFWDRLEREVKTVTINREKSTITYNNGAVVFTCYILNDINSHLPIIVTIN